MVCVSILFNDFSGFFPAFQPFFQLVFCLWYLTVSFFLNPKFDINKTITGNNKVGVFFPIPITFMPDSLNRIANLVKSDH
jgi:hypothetical protein